MRFLRQLIVSMFIFVILSATVWSYNVVPYEMQVKLTYRVDVYQLFASVYLYNVTVNMNRNAIANQLQCETPSTLIPQFAFANVENPNRTFTMEINTSLVQDGVMIKQCNMTKAFDKQGEYILIAVPTIFDVSPNTYGLMIFYSDSFNAVRTIFQNSWNNTVVVY